MRFTLLYLTSLQRTGRRGAKPLARPPFRLIHERIIGLPSDSGPTEELQLTNEQTVALRGAGGLFQRKGIPVFRSGRSAAGKRADEQSPNERTVQGLPDRPGCG